METQAMIDLREKAALKLAEAKQLNDKPDKTAEDEARIEALMAEEGKLMASYKQSVNIEEELQKMNQPGPSAAKVSWANAKPGEGEEDIDSKAWREVKIETPSGPKEFRYFVPLRTQGKDYRSAFEAYLVKGLEQIGPNDRKTLTEGLETGGGVLVPADYQTEIIKKTAAIAVVRSMARIVTTGRDRVKWPRINYSTDNIKSAPHAITWTGETPSSATAAAITDQTFGEIDIPVNTAMASQGISRDLIEDSAADLMGLSTDLFAENIALDEENAFINGTGSTRPRGILYGVAGTDCIAATNSGTAANVTANGLIDTFFAVPAQYRGAAQWLLNSATMGAIEKLTDTYGRYIVQTMINSSLQALPFEILKGKPVRISEYMPSEAANAYPVVVGDFKGYIIVDRVGLSIERLTDSAYSKLNQVGLLARKRVGGLLAEAYKLRANKCSA
jgi:HK97 family phage major capsid protein